MDRESVRTIVIDMLKELREDWDYSGELSEDTGIFQDLGFESIDAVALGAAIEERFGQPLPFAEFLTHARDEQVKDITIARLVDFLLANLKPGLEKSAV
jgi:acyl carrier protein